MRFAFSHVQQYYHIILNIMPNALYSRTRHDSDKNKQLLCGDDFFLVFKFTRDLDKRIWRVLISPLISSDTVLDRYINTAKSTIFFLFKKKRVKRKQRQ